jgi:hypothetical protein
MATYDILEHVLAILPKNSINIILKYCADLKVNIDEQKRVDEKIRQIFIDLNDMVKQ